MDNQDQNMDIVAESDNFAVWRSETSDDNDVYYHIELGSITLHFTSEEWEEFVVMVKSAA